MAAVHCVRGGKDHFITTITTKRSKRYRMRKQRHPPAGERCMYMKSTRRTRKGGQREEVYMYLRIYLIWPDSPRKGNKHFSRRSVRGSKGNGQDAKANTCKKDN